MGEYGETITIVSHSTEEYKKVIKKLLHPEHKAKAKEKLDEAKKNIKKAKKNKK